MRKSLLLLVLLGLGALPAMALGDDPVMPYAAIGVPGPESGEVVVLKKAELAEEAAQIAVFHQNLRVKMPHRTAVRSEIVERLPDNHYALEIQNEWASEHFKVPREDVQGRQWQEVPERARWLSRTPLAPAQKLDGLVRSRYGKALNDVYKPASGPFFNDTRGLHWDKKSNRYVLVVRGEIDPAANRCFKAAIDIEAGEVISEAETQCKVR